MGQEQFTPEEEQGDVNEINVEILKSVCEKCTQQHEEFKLEHQNPMFGINVELEESEIAEIEKIIDRARTVWSNFADNEPLWSKFESILAQRRDKVGTFGEASKIIENPNITNIIKGLEGEIPTIIVPTNIKHLYLWESEIDGFEDTLKDYQDGFARGRSAKKFGQTLFHLHSFIKNSPDIE